MRISEWSSAVFSSHLVDRIARLDRRGGDPAKVELGVQSLDLQRIKSGPGADQHLIVFEETADVDCSISFEVHKDAADGCVPRRAVNYRNPSGVQHCH